DKSGKFQLHKNVDTAIKRLIFNYIGYQTKTINVTDGNVGEIMLLPEAQSLAESVVIGNNTTFKNGKRIVTPTTEQIEKSPTGFILLDNLNLPRLNIDIDKKSISAMGGGNVVMLINGREADRGEIVGLDPKTIINVEYSDIPSARFAGAAIVVNFIVKQVEKGGFLATDLTNGLTMIYGEDDFFVKFYNGASQFSVWYMPQFRDLKSQWRENEETFNLNNGTLTRREIGEPARFRYLFNNISFRYNYYTKKRMFDAAFTSEIENFPDNNFKSKLLANTSSDTLFMTDNSRNTSFTPRLRLYYQESLGANQTLYTSLTWNYNKRNYKREYEELLNNNTVENYFFSDVDEKQQVYNAIISYDNLIKLGKSGWVFNLMSSLKHSYINTKNIYNNQYQNISSEIDVHRTTADVLGLFSKNYSYIFGKIGLARNEHSTNEINVTKYNFYGTIGAKYQLSEKSSITTESYIRYNAPNLSDLNNISQFIDSLQIKRGNSYIRPAVDYGSFVFFMYENKKIRIVPKIEYKYTKNPIMENSYLEDQYVIRSIENHKNFQILRPEISASFNKIWNFLYIRFWFGLSHYISNGNTYKHTNNIFWTGGRINILYKKWQLIYEIWSKDSDSFFGETLQKSEGGDKLTLYYISKQFYLGIGCFNPIFAQARMNAQINYSAVAPYRRYEYMDNFKRGNGIFIKFVKTFKWGHEKDDVDVNAEDVKSESAILKGNK
ncbi:MAG: hypothetical protein LBP63_00285, partial [Prevotellaceae bacterium]|nr:hypothetical protein [Prevotellaceae bacterium]